MLEELAEDAVAGELATIYEEIRSTTGVPYVSSLQRHLATRPGWLEWGWSVVGPGFRDGSIPNIVWHIADDLVVPALPGLTTAQLRCLGVDETGEAEIHNVLDSFIRVSPTNLAFSGISRRLLLNDHATEKLTIDATPRQRSVINALPALIDIDELNADQKAVLMSMSTTVDGQDFVPGLYRMLARWPGWFAHTVNVLVPRRADADLACRDLAARIDDVVPQMMQPLALTPAPLKGGAQERDRIVAAIDRYRETSPQMVVYCRMIKEAMPASEQLA